MNALPKWLRFWVIPGLVSFLLTAALTAFGLWLWSRLVDAVDMFTADHRSPLTSSQLALDVSDLTNGVELAILVSGGAVLLASWAWLARAATFKLIRTSGAGGAAPTWWLLLATGIAVQAGFFLWLYFLSVTPLDGVGRLSLVMHTLVLLFSYMIGYWIVTAISTPRFMRPAVPGASMLPG